MSGEEVTAKEFRTWAATDLAAMTLTELERFGTEAKNEKNVLRAVAHVAERLGHTPSVCRQCDTPPAVFDGCLNGSIG